MIKVEIGGKYPAGRPVCSRIPKNSYGEGAPTQYFARGPHNFCYAPAQKGLVHLTTNPLHRHNLTYWKTQTHGQTQTKQTKRGFFMDFLLSFSWYYELLRLFSKSIIFRISFTFFHKNSHNICDFLLHMLCDRKYSAFVNWGDKKNW